MNEISYFAPTSVEEAVNLLAEHRGKITILAGGTDLVSKINYYKLKPQILMYIGGLGLNYIKEKVVKMRRRDLLIGATTSTGEIAASTLLQQKADALAEAARLSGTEAVRTTATIGGNLANASPAADLVTPLLVMDAEITLTGPSGQRVLPVGEFFTGPGKTVLEADELITQIQMPVPERKTTFLKLGRRKAMTLSVVNVAVRLDVDGGGRCKDVRIAMGAMAPIPMRCTKAEQMIKGQVLDRESIAGCASAAVAETGPIDDQRATAWYRRKVATHLLLRALTNAAGL